MGPVAIKISDMHTGTWRYERPIIHSAGCVACAICVEYCPCGAVSLSNGTAVVDYIYCKGCGICAKECPRGAIEFALESLYRKEENQHGEKDGT